MKPIRNLLQTKQRTSRKQAQNGDTPVVWEVGKSLIDDRNSPQFPLPPFNNLDCTKLCPQAMTLGISMSRTGTAAAGREPSCGAASVSSMPGPRRRLSVSRRAGDPSQLGLGHRVSLSLVCLVVVL